MKTLLHDALFFVRQLVILITSVTVTAVVFERFGAFGAAATLVGITTAILQLGNKP